MVKIVEAIRQANEHGRHFFSFEFVAPTTEAGTITLYDRIERLSALDPLFCGITWNNHGRTAETSVEVASTCQSLLSVNFQVNLTGYTSRRDEVLNWLTILKEKRVRNLLLTRGSVTNAAVDNGCDVRDARSSHATPAHDCLGEEVDATASTLPVSAAAVPLPSSPSSSPSTGSAFPHAVDLIRFVRQNFGDYFGIAVVAFPEGDLPVNDDSDIAAPWTAAQQDTELFFLKEKVDAGADFIVTQSIFDVTVFDQFYSLCRQRGIRCPILPGVLPVFQARRLRASGLGRLAGAEELLQSIGAVKGTESEVKRVAVKFYQRLVVQLLARGCGGVYFFTLNMDYFLLSILKGIDVTTHRIFPWRPSENEERRRLENVRPVHWSSRVASYMVRTAHWRETNDAKWNPVSAFHHGSATALCEAGGYHARLLLRSRAKRCTQFLIIQGMPETESVFTELSRIFVAFLDGCGTLPWSDELSGETAYLSERLLKPLNSRGLYTINSQPAVNGAPSSHKVVGWGPGNGYVYQKGYLEFFCPLSTVQIVFTTLEKYPSLQYMAMNADGSIVRARWPVGAGTHGETSLLTQEGGFSLASLPPPAPQQHVMALFGTGVTAVTWGVFPGREVVQPTIVSVDSFRAWVGEAFDLWAAPFPSTDVPAVVRYIQTKWTLISVVDNAYQESPTFLERAVVEICSKIPPLIPEDLTQMLPQSPLTFTTAGDAEVNTLGQFTSAA